MRLIARRMPPISISSRPLSEEWLSQRLALVT